MAETRPGEPRARRPRGLADDLELVAAGPGVAGAIAALASRTIAGAWSENSFAKQLARPGCRALLVRRNRHRGRAIERDGSAIVAFLIAEKTLSELEVLNVAVAPDARRRGIAFALLARALADASNDAVDVVHLEVRASNRAARRLYEAHGFQIVGKRPRYYADGEDAILMSLGLVPIGDA